MAVINKYSMSRQPWQKHNGQPKGLLQNKYLLHWLLLPITTIHLVSGWSHLLETCVTLSRHDNKVTPQAHHTHILYSWHPQPQLYNYWNGYPSYAFQKQMCVVESITYCNSACVCDILKIQPHNQLVQTKLYCVSAWPCSSDPMFNTDWCTLSLFLSIQDELWLLHCLFQLFWAGVKLVLCFYVPPFRTACNGSFIVLSIHTLVYVIFMFPAAGFVHWCIFAVTPPSLSHTLSKNGQNDVKLQKLPSTFKSHLFLSYDGYVCCLGGCWVLAAWWLVVCHLAHNVFIIQYYNIIIITFLTYWWTIAIIHVWKPVATTQACAICFSSCVTIITIITMMHTPTWLCLSPRCGVVHYVLYNPDSPRHNVTVCPLCNKCFP